MNESPKSKKVLVIAYFFPPMGGGGVQRTVKFVKYLRDFGYEPVVLTVKSGKHTAFDSSFDRDIPKDVRIIRTRYLGLPQPTKKPETAGDTKPLTGSFVARVKSILKKPAVVVYRFVEKYFFYPDVQMLWRPFAYRAGLSVLRSEHFDCIYSTSSPYTTHLIARDLHRITGVPWVADFRDHWTLGPLYSNVSSLHGLLDRYLENSILSDASGVVFNTETNEKEAIAAFPRLTKNHTAIYNGFDPGDFVSQKAYERSGQTINSFYIGSLYGKEYSCKELVAAFEKACEQKPNIRLTFIGDIDRANSDIIKNSSVFGKSIILKTYMPHHEVTRIEESADLLFALVGNAPNTDCWVPQKLYGYLGAHRPIFALASEKGEVAKILEATDGGEVVSQFKAPEEIAAKMIRFIEKLEQRNFELTPRQETLAPFERRNQAKQLASFFSEVTNA